MEARPVVARPPIFRGYPPIFPRVIIPSGYAGLSALYNACRQIYPDQPNPLQVAAVVKFWNGGPDPIDYISMYSNPGNPATGTEPHWHYISFGLSDLYGDGRVHEMSSPATPSGFGFELTFRLKREPEETGPPTWPAAIMQALAKYVFSSESNLNAGDHVSWHCPLDNSESRIQHMLMCDDPQLGTVQTPYGPVTFTQIVGVCSEELQAAQEWNGPGVVDLMKTVEGAGGPWLVTNMKRSQSIFELDASIREAVDEGIEEEGSNLTGVSARCSWSEIKPVIERDEQSELEHGFAQISVSENEKTKTTMKKGLSGSKAMLSQISPNGGNNFYSSATTQNTSLARRDSYDTSMSEEMGPLASYERTQVRYLEGVHLFFNLEAGTMIPLALKGRLKIGRHFTFNNATDETIITLVPLSVTGAFVDLEHPYAVRGPWLQILLNDEDIETMLIEFIAVSELDAIVLPKTFKWCNGRVVVTLMHEDF